MLQTIDISERSFLNAKKVVEAASDQGFLLLTNHPFSRGDLDDLFDISKSFFDLPVDEKKKYLISPTNEGYIPFRREDLQEDGTGKGDLKECFNLTHIDLTTFKPQQELPSVLKRQINKLSELIQKYYDILFAMCKLLAIGLDIRDENNQLDEDYFVRAHDLNLKQQSTLRLLHYNKPIGEEANENLCGAHTDYGSLTFLFQRPNGDLQVKTSSGWVNAVTKDDDTIIVNIADMLSFWTNGKLKSTLHRVRCTQERFSVAFFAQPADDVLLDPVPSSICKNLKGRGASEYVKTHGKSMTSLQHLQKRLAKGYGWKKE